MNVNTKMYNVYTVVYSLIQGGSSTTLCIFLLLYPEEEDNHEHEEEKDVPKIFEDSQLAYLVDPVLDHEDVNKDGYIDYPEFVAAAKKNKKQK